jgi:hypothetical protein
MLGDGTFPNVAPFFRNNVHDLERKFISMIEIHISPVIGKWTTGYIKMMPSEMRFIRKNAYSCVA